MSNHRLLLLIVVGAVALALPACGGGGQGLRVLNDPLLVTSTSMPTTMLSGEMVNHVIPIQGGCGGPYVLQLIAGDMPDGLVLDNDTHALVGFLLEDGDFDFTVQLSDSGCDPFSATTARFQFSVGVGDIVVVDVLRDGSPSLIPVGGASYNPDYPAFPSVVYNDYNTLQLIVAGGHGPYSMVVWDKPGVADGQLPLGASVPPFSTSVTGAPVQVGDGGQPFLITFLITDNIGGTGEFTVYWEIATPPIVIALDDLSDGVCGLQYSDTFLAVEGVPPFLHEFVEMGLPDPYESDKNPGPQNPGAHVLYNPDSPPTVTPPQALNKIDNTVYPALNAPQSNYHQTDQGAPPEGITLNEESGAFSGIPRRRGTFQVNYHVFSSLVPNSFGQHAWQTYEFFMAQAAQIQQDAAYTLDGAPFALSAPYNRIADFEVGYAYNPDGGPAGLQFLATDGVPEDGLSDWPHTSQALANPPVPAETPGAYVWTLDWGPDGQITGTDFDAAGVLFTTNPALLQSQFYQDISTTVFDSALPTTLAADDTQFVRVSVGPDVSVITESTTSFTGANSSTQNHPGLHDANMTVKVMLGFTSGPEIKTLLDSRDLPGTGTTQLTLDDLPIPSSTTLSTLLSGIDMLRVSGNPTGWWQDNFNMNPRGLRGFQHADANKTRGAYANAYGYVYSSGSYVSAYGAAPDSSLCDIPKCITPDTVVTENKSLGIYKDGGKLAAFDSQNYIGVFVIRKDSKIYVPFALHKTSTSLNTWGCKAFGDNWHYNWSSTGVVLTMGKIPQMTVSPDGRFAAMKIMPTFASYTYNGIYQWTGNKAGDSYIVLMSLTGEQIPAWGDQTYTVIETGSDGTILGGGEVLHADSMTLTNSHLYYVCSNKGYGDVYSWREHYFYRYGLFSTDDEGELIPSGGDSEWTLGTGTYPWMQAPLSEINEMFYNYVSGSYVNQSIRYCLYNDGYNGHEGSAAPHPFRVNADGQGCVIVAGKPMTTTTGTSSTLSHRHHVWMDWYSGSGDPTLTRLSSVLRRIPHGGGRGTRLTAGPTTGYYYSTAHQWGHYTGPTTALEVSDDGTKVAVVVSRHTGTVYHYNNQAYNSNHYPSRNWNGREDIIAFTAGTDDTWGTSDDTEIQLTGTESTASPTFENSPNIQWRFGALTFTKDNDGLVFWGGFSAYDPDYASSTTSYYYGSYTFVGNLYSYDFTDTTPGVKSMLDEDDGGADLTVGTEYSGSSQIGTSSWTSQWEKQGGVICPMGGFISANREYMYIMNNGSLYSSGGATKQQQYRLLGANIASLSGDTTLSGHTEGEAFPVGNWPSRRGFTPGYGYTTYPYHYMGIRYAYYCNVYGSSIVMAPESGWVFFGAHYQTGGPGRSTSVSYGGPVNATYASYAYYGPFCGQLAVFDSDVGGDVELISSLSQTLGSSYSNSTNRFMKYIEPSPDGRSVGWVYSSAQSYSWPVDHDSERLGYTTDLDLDPDTGDLNGYDRIQDVVGANRRISTSITHDAQGGKIIFASGTGNENARQIYDQVAGTSASPNSYGQILRRYNILHSGR